MHVQIIQVESIRAHRRRTCEGIRDDAIGDGRIDVKGDVEGVINLFARDIKAVTLDESVVGEGVKIWAWAPF